MTMPRIVLFLLFVAIPLLELALLIKFGQSLGFWPTLGLVVGTALIGAKLLHDQGFAALNSANEAIRAGRPPLEAVVEGVFIIAAGALLISPGLMTDTLGILLLIPPLRRAIAKWSLARLLATSDFEIAIFGEDIIKPADQDPAGAARRTRGQPGPEVIEGEFERLDETTIDPRRGRRPPPPT
jgi:UPF0716 protein FxsA